MAFGLPQLLIATALLWLPRGGMRMGRRIGPRGRRHRLAHSWTHAPQDGTVLTVGHEFTRFRNYLDLFRAAVATALLVGTYDASPVRPLFADGPDGARTALLVQVGILAIGLCLQAIRWDRHGVALAAPTFYLAGVLCGLKMPLPGLCAFAVAWALVPVLPYSQGFLTAMAAVFALVGVFFHGVDPLVLAGSALCFAPVVASLLSRRPLLVFSRKPGATR